METVPLVDGTQKWIRVLGGQIQTLPNLLNACFPSSRHFWPSLPSLAPLSALNANIRTIPTAEARPLPCRSPMRKITNHTSPLHSPSDASGYGSTGKRKAVVPVSTNDTAIDSGNKNRNGHKDGDEDDVAFAIPSLPPISEKPASKFVSLLLSASHMASLDGIKDSDNGPSCLVIWRD